MAAVIWASCNLQGIFLESNLNFDMTKGVENKEKDMIGFQAIYNRAADRKGGEAALKQLLPPVMDIEDFKHIPDDRILSVMARVINQAGFNWSVIERKWPQFEEAFHGFDTDKLAHLTDEEWGNYSSDTRVVRHAQKIKAVRENCHYVRRISSEHGSFAAYILTFPVSDQIGLMAALKKQGTRLGGNSGQYFLRFIGRDGFVLSQDVIACLRHNGLEIQESPTSKKDLTAIQDTFNHWHQETGLPYTHLSKIAAYSIGADFIGVEGAENPIQNELKKLGLDH